MSACSGDSKSRYLCSLGSDKSLRVWISGPMALEPFIFKQFLLQSQLHNNLHSELHLSEVLVYAISYEYSTLGKSESLSYAM